MAGINNKIWTISKYIHSPYENIIFWWWWIKPWVYRNQQLWLISISWDLVNRITLEDKNYWATNAWDWVSAWSYDVRWHHYQRWNDYWFINTTWSYIDDRTWTTAWEITLPYNSSTWITTNQWASNLHTLTRTWENIKTWYHIGSRSEYQSILDIFVSWWVTEKESIQKLLKMPNTWYRDTNSYFNANYINSNTWVWTGTHTGYTDQYSWWWHFTCLTNSNKFMNSWSCHWRQIRLFKNEVVVPDKTRMALYQN